MFAFSFFDGSHICRFLPILRPPTVPRSHFRYPKTKSFILIISHLYFQIVTSASENKHSAWESDMSLRYINLSLPAPISNSSFCRFDDDSAISGQGVFALVVYLADDVNLIVSKSCWHVHFNCRRSGIADSCLCVTHS